MAAPTLAALAPKYARQWADMQINPNRVATLDQIAHRLIANKARYQVIQSKTGVPWWWVAIIHNRESGGNFAGVLHNGEHIIGTGQKTRLVPAGRGPFSSWEEAAIDALLLKGLQKIKNWSLEVSCYRAEEFNGWGYYWRGVPSAYLWSFSNIYRGGKYVADGVWSATAMDAQAGVMPLLKRMMVADPSIKFSPVSIPAESAPKAPPVVRDTSAGAGAGAAAGGLAAWFGAHPIVIVLAAAAVAAAVFFAVRYFKRKDQ